MLKRDVSAIFYDIESLNNVFTVAAFAPSLSEENPHKLYVFYLHDKSDNSDFEMNLKDKKMVASRIREKNKNFNGSIFFYDLKEVENVKRLASMFGVSIASWVNKTPTNTLYRLICDTDKNYEEAYTSGQAPFLFGYNSANYDTTMLAYYFSKMCCENVNKSWRLTSNIKYNMTAAEMREFNNILFSNAFKSDNHMPEALRYEDLDAMHRVIQKQKIKPDFKLPGHKIRKNMMMSGRHLDVAKLPGKQNFLGLKNILGMLGYQILESDKLNDRTAFVSDIDQMADLIAYNASDVINLELLFYNDLYKAQFDLKRELLNTYKEIVYEAIEPEYNKKDFTMPPEKEGVFNEEHHAYAGYAPNVDPQHVRKDRLFIDSSSAQLATRVLCPYGQLNDLVNVQYTYPEAHEAKRLGVESVDVLESTKQWVETNLVGDKFKKARSEFDDIYQYYRSLRGHNFNSSDSYANKYDPINNEAATVYKIDDPYMFSQRNNCMPYYDGDGKETSCYVTFSIGGIHGAEYNKALYNSDLEKYKCDPIKNKRPALFQYTEGEKTKLNPRYTYTSCDMTNHEDFSSYYPNLLRRMRAFWNNGLGYDRYGVIFDLKQEYGRLMKDKSLSEEARNKYRILREGTKLILNSASGAADATFESSIRMNNRIIAMRIIGQLFTWRIGQAQSLHGAKITSTNTDGLYSVLEEKLNNELLEKEAKSINVEIEPEPCFLITKDSNNRIEADQTNNGLVITSASGGTLSCRKGPNPAKALDHPAVVDWILAEYMRICSDDLDKEFDKEIGMQLAESAIDGACCYNKTLNKNACVLNMFQTMIKSNPASYNYKYGKDQSGNIVILQHYNRAFIMKDNITDKPVLHISQATARALNDKTFAKRQSEMGGMNDKSVYQHDEEGLYVLKQNGITLEDLYDMRNPRREASVSKVSRIDPNWNILIENHNLNELSDSDTNWILTHLDLMKYVDMACKSFNENWKNQLPEKEIGQISFNFYG